MEWHSISGKECMQRLSTDDKKGLSDKAAAERLAKYGKNQLDQKKKHGVVYKFLSQFADFMVLILLAAAGISFVTAFMSGEDFTDPIMILLIVVLNAAVGTVQECRAENAIDALKKLSSPHAQVIRNGKASTIPSAQVVPGDIMIISTGDLIPADARLISSTALSVEESSLTGESVPADKTHDAVLGESIPLGDRSNMVYASTIVSSGHGTAVVTETGMNTRVGRIAEMIDNEESPSTPLQKGLSKTGRILGTAALGICALIFILGMMQNVPPLEMFMISISLAVAAIPEGLPAVVTIVLALGVRKMALHRAIVRHLPAVETLGCTNVICSDKTGTLTQNKMTVTNISDAEGTVSAHSPQGAKILSLAALCCTGSVTGKAGDFAVTGSPTEKAILTAAAEAGQLKSALDSRFPQLREIPFDSKRKRMATVHALPTGGYRVIAKGAPDILLSLCTKIQRSSGAAALTPADRKKLLSKNEALASNAMRMLAVAFKDCTYLPEKDEQAESELIFCGLIGMTDPPRPQAKAAVAACKKAGIRPVMITGDHVMTASAIGAELGICTKGSRALTGAELDKLSQKELEDRVWSYSVFARVSPEHKVRIVKAYQANGAVVAMTGDGVNDAPALRCSDIGCAMGISGTDAAKGAADMVLTDDNFSTIVEAVEQGRGIFSNIKRVIHFLLACNIGEILTVLCAFLMKLPTPLLALQLLWVNLVTDSMPALALGVEPVDGGIMDRPPVSAKKGIFDRHMVISMLAEGCLIGALAFLAFTIGRVFFDAGSEPVIGRTMTFAVLSLSQLVHAFDLKSEHSLFRTGIFNNLKLVGAFVIGCIMQISVISLPFLCAIFRTAPLTALQWTIVILLSLAPMVLSEAEKLISGIRQAGNDPKHSPPRK